jgi:hypothetical protein
MELQLLRQNFNIIELGWHISIYYNEYYINLNVDVKTIDLAYLNLLMTMFTNIMS